MKKVVVIGGGAAGLTAGIFALRHGFDCTLIEKNKTGAGALCGWRRGGYEIDGCLHWLTGTREGTELNDIWRITGMMGGEWVRTPSLFSSTTHGKTVSFYDDAERTREELIAAYPEDRREIDKLHRAISAAASLSGLEGERAMSKFESFALLAPYALLGAGELAERFRSEGMKRAVCDLTGKYYSSLGLIFAYSAYSRGNGYLPSGGSRGAADRMTDMFKKTGGKYIAGERAVRIKRDGGGYTVLLSGGDAVFADRVICCIDPLRAVSLFEGVSLPEKFAGKLRRRSKYPLFSSVHFAFSAKSSDVPFRGTLFFPVERQMIGSVNRDRMMLREFSHEPSFAPEGETVLQTMFFTDEKTSRGWIELKKGGAGYGEAKEAAAREVKERITSVFPSLSRSIKLIDSWTPATFSRYLGSNCGSYMSFALTPGTIPASFPMTVPGLDGAVFASGWTKSPGGVPNAAYAGRDAVLALTRMRD